MESEVDIACGSCSRDNKVPEIALECLFPIMRFCDD
jgi:hypothetical protein